ncbi:Pentatricopeptide repeat-containing protein [Dichanthelium oligosanthes]|uniref:Pentatricopeptide repeat-containing protein n=1 Tax=Dichanthelium oligosanthes TaxID=888268 RepID=A0A1E5W7P7_9POAL|nr:Pentatricopeptide repeat-containing protein [Dichanthelium oligosanthes]
MLRTKQLGTLTQCARSFYLNGSRCSSTDGASCTCPEDENYAPKRQAANGIEQKSRSNHRASVKAHPPVQHVAGSIGQSTGHPAPAVHAVSSTSPPGKESASANRSNDPRSHHKILGSDYVQPSKQTARSISQSGIAGAGVYSELVNFRAHNQHSFPEAKLPYNSSMNNDFEKGIPRAGNAKPKQSFSGPSVIVSGSPSQIRNQGRPGPNGFSCSGNKFQSPTGTIKAHGGGPQSNLRSLKSLRAANQVLKLLHDHTIALGFFDWQFGILRKLLEEMSRAHCKPTVEAGYEPDRVTYCTLIDIHAKAGYLDVAMDLYGRMQEAKARNYENVVKLYKDMQVAGFRPDKITYSIVMEVLGHCGHLNEAEAVFIEMRRDWAPDEPVYGLLVDLWGKAGNVDKALGWYQAMLQDGLLPNTYTLLLSCCTETQAHMGLCCQLMSITGHPAHMFLLYLPDAEPGGQNVRDHTGYFLDMMHSEDRESKRGLMDAVIDFLHKSGLKEEAGLIWEVAAQKNVTLAWFHRQILTMGTAPERIDIVTGWGRRSRVTGSSLVRQSVQKLLNLFEFPFFTTRGNTGCFVGCGEPLNKWLHNPYVERMHLL